MKIIFTISLIFIVGIFESFSQSIVGDWTGTLEVQGTTLEIVIHIVQDGVVYSSTLDSPNQGAFGIEMDDTAINGNNLTITSKKMGLNLTGTHDPLKNTITCNFKQGPMDLPLNLTRIVEHTNEGAKEATSDHMMTGDWNGSLDAMGTILRIVLHVEESEGKFSSTMDSPDQSAYGIKIDETTVEENTMTISSKAISMTWTGTYDAESNTMNGEFKQGGRTMPLILGREEIEKKELIRPQEPKSFDYKQEEVQFTNENGGHRLAGTLTIPKSGNFEKIAVLVTGSGPQDRNEELIGHKPFLVISDYLTRNGVAVLRYDDRGVAESEGDFQSATSDDFATDAEAALSYLRSRDDMKEKKFGIIGHSEGGMIAPIVASRSEIDYIVLLAGPGTELDVLLAEQSKAISVVSGIEETTIEFNAKVSKIMFAYMKSNNEQDQETFEKGLRKILIEEMDKLSAAEKEKIGDMSTEIENQISALTTPWFRYFLSFSPKEYLTKVKCPVLAITGENDLQVLPKSNLKAIGRALSEGGNLNYTIRELPKLNHLFQVSETGNPNNYGKIEETFNEGALEIILNWVNTFDK